MYKQCCGTIELKQTPTHNTKGRKDNTGDRKRQGQHKRLNNYTMY